MDFEFAYYDVVIQHVNHDAMRTSHHSDNFGDLSLFSQKKKKKNGSK